MILHNNKISELSNSYCKMNSSTRHKILIFDTMLTAINRLNFGKFAAHISAWIIPSLSHVYWYSQCLMWFYIYATLLISINKLKVLSKQGHCFDINYFDFQAEILFPSRHCFIVSHQYYLRTLSTPLQQIWNCCNKFVRPYSLRCLGACFVNCN